MNAKVATDPGVERGNLIRDRLEMLAERADELRRSPGMGLRLLQPDALGWVRTPHHPEAIRIWTEQLRESPGNVSLLHHLAIAHHARAFDLEPRNDAVLSNADWNAALAYWKCLWESDGFWDRLAAIACRNTRRDPVDRLRRDLPALLLQVHFDIAFDAETPPYRAYFHIRQARDSGFPDGVIAEVRRRTYDRLVAGLPADVWQESVLDASMIERGLACVRRYLNLDPEHEDALKDALRLEYRLLLARFQDLVARGEKGLAEMRGLKRAADSFAPFVDRLGGLATLTADLREKLATWYRIIGEVHLRLELAEKALAYFRKASEFIAPDSEEHQRASSRVGDLLARRARESAQAGEPSAPALIDEALSHPVLDLDALKTLAGAAALIGDHARLIAVCSRAETDVAESSSSEESEARDLILAELAALKEDAQSAEERVLRLEGERCRELMKAGRFEEALARLDGAICRDVGNAELYQARGQCYRHFRRLEEARRDGATFRQLTASPVESPRDDHLERAMNLREQVDQLRRALAEAVGDDAPPLRRRLAEALVESALLRLPGPDSPPGDSRREEAEKMLREAAGLDPENRRVPTLLDYMSPDTP